MGKARESVEVAASLAEAWEYYFEPSGWPSWVEGFEAVERSEGYPDAEGTLSWRSIPSGRGTVFELVLAHEPRSLHRIAFDDPYSEGQLETSFEIAGENVRVTQAVTYEIKDRGPLGSLMDRFFVRGQVGRSLAGALARFKHEVEELAAIRERA